jgi:hypothetical protein
MGHALLTAMLLVALLPACATLQDTPAQQRSWAAFKQCESSFPGVKITRVEPDGRTWFSYQSPAALAAMRACMDQHRTPNARTGQAASAAARSEPPRGPLAEPPRAQSGGESSVWAYTVVSETMASFNLVAYATLEARSIARRAARGICTPMSATALGSKPRSRNVGRLSCCPGRAIGRST